MAPGRVLLFAICYLGALAPIAGCSRSGGGPGGTGGGGGKGNGARDGSADAPDRPGGTGGKGMISCPATGSRSGAPGETCSCDVDCKTGFCTDGVCCDTACKDSCTSCDLPGSEGTCTPVPEGVKARNASECPAEAAASCGRDGTCDGKGGCRLYVASTSCMGGSCDSDSVSGAYVCDGKGTCKLGPTLVCWPFGCNQGKCRETCATDADCSVGGKCTNNRCGKLPTGRGPCSKDDDCISSHCSGGFCCNDACDGACLSCDQTGFEGQCRPLGLGMAHPKCAVQGRPSCGTTGVCDGFGSCAVYDADTTCTPPSCSGDVANTPGTCDGNGTCQPPEQVECDPFMCSGTACATVCTTDAQCVKPNTCVNGSCGMKPMGSACTAAAECISNFCVDGFCCENACDGACRTCGLSGSPGRCVNVADGRDDPHKQCKDAGAASCGLDGKCDGSGACRRYGTTTVCAAETCTSGSYTGPATCSTGGQCIPPASRTCYPFMCNGSRCFGSCTQTSGQCVSPNSCVGGSCGLKPAGASCSVASDCLPAADGKSYCSQGVCCNSTCSGACQACNLGASSGTCSAVANGTADNRCATSAVGTCGTNGTCRAGGCDVYHTTNQCKAPSCSGTTTSLAASFCDGRGGACPSQGTVQCGSFTCDTATGSCRTSCDNDTQCVAPSTCNNHSCGKKGNGTTCSAGTQCDSGNCVEGVCCNSACSSASSGLCQSCKVSNHIGTCTPVPAGGTDPGARCKASDRTSCGLDGTCDGAGKCRNWDSSTSCRNQSCPSGTTQTNAATCDGKGACSASTTKNCSPYACNVNASTCRTTCTGTADCASGVTCNTQTNKCGDKLPLGTTCGVDGDCSEGHCAKARAADTTGICCNTTCTGGCQSCALSSSKGTCTSIPAGTAPRDPDANTCPTSSNTCGNTGKCDGKGACQLPPDGTSCSDGNMCTLLDTCKSGACVGASPVTCKAVDQCHTVGTCNATTGACSTPNAPNGTMCSDGSACTTGEACMAGACTGGTTKTCAATDACHTAGTCDPTSGACSTPNAPNGTTCSDGNPCTTPDTCMAGTCKGGAAKTCTASDQCHLAGTCDPTSGACSDPPAPSTKTCNDGSLCTPVDTCDGMGNCKGSSPKTCSASDQCHAAGTCDPTTGMCSDPPAPTTKTCSTGNLCVTGEKCDGLGDCKGGTTRVCTASDQCHVAGTCDSTSGMCSDPPAATTKTCSTGNACITGEKCDGSGNCKGGTTKTCSASDQCHVAGTCDSTSGMCSDPPAPSTKMCSTGNLCIMGEKCDGMGECKGSPKMCPAGDSCHGASTCQPASGACSDPPEKDDGTSCGMGMVCCSGTCTDGTECP